MTTKVNNALRLAGCNPDSSDEDVSEFECTPPYPPDPNSALHRRPHNIIRTTKYENTPPYTPAPIQQYINTNITSLTMLWATLFEGHALGSNTQSPMSERGYCWVEVAAAGTEIQRQLAFGRD